MQHTLSHEDLVKLTKTFKYALDTIALSAATFDALVDEDVGGDDDAVSALIVETKNRLLRRGMAVAHALDELNLPMVDAVPETATPDAA